MALPVNPPLDDCLADDDRLEFRSIENAWYDVDLSRDGDRLIIKYRSMSSAFDEVYQPGNFQSVEDVNCFRDRFRPSSSQVQDDECCKIVPGIKLCAAYSFEDSSLWFFDAVVEEVIKKEHTFSDGEEQCCCSFVLSWLDGQHAGRSTTVGVESLCFLRDGPLQKTLVDFVKIARTTVMNSRSLVPVPEGDTILDTEPSISDVMHESTHGHRQEETSPQLQITSQQLKDQDTYTDKSDANVIPPGIQGRCHYVLAIENLEKDLSPSTMTEFIHKETSIIPEAHIFPSFKTDLFTRGILKVHSESEFKKLLEFLENPNQIVLSSRNRPWVVTETFSGEDNKSLVRNTMTNMEHCHDMGSSSELKVIFSGTDEYIISKELKENYTEFNRHQKHVLQRLAFEDEKILRQSSKIRNRGGG